MADVWVSRKRWTCKYCNVTINDDPPSRKHHESGVRHKRNVARALDDLHKQKDAKRREDTQMQMALQYMEKSARKRGEQGVPMRMERAPAPPPKTWKPSESAYTTASSLGLTPEQNEEEWQRRCQRRSLSADIGEWHTLPEAPSQTSYAVSGDHHNHKEQARMSEGPMSDHQRALTFALKERAVGDDEEDDEDVPIVLKRPRPNDAMAYSVASTSQDTPSSQEDATLFKRRKPRSGTALRSASQK